MLTLLCALLAAAPAHAYSTTTGYVTQVLFYASGNDYACQMKLGSTSTYSSSSGTWYYVDDVSGEFAATCNTAMLAMYFNRSVTVYYSGSRAYGLASTNTSSNVPYLWTNDATGTSSADRCLATLNSSSGTVNAYVDDGNPEEGENCALFAMLHYVGGAGWTVNNATAVNYIYANY